MRNGTAYARLPGSAVASTCVNSAPNANQILTQRKEKCPKNCAYPHISPTDFCLRNILENQAEQERRRNRNRNQRNQEVDRTHPRFGHGEQAARKLAECRQPGTKRQRNQQQKANRQNIPNEKTRCLITLLNPPVLFALTSQILLSAERNSPKTPDATNSSATTPITDAQAPLAGFCECSITVLTASAPSCPIIP